MLRNLLLCCGLLAGVTAMGGDGVSSNDWPQWRGPGRDGQSSGGPWPSRLKGALRQEWRVELGPSYSGPIVVGSRVVTTETVEKEREAVRVHDRSTGRLLWKVEWPGAMTVPFFARSNGDWIRATPASDGERLYVAGMRDVLVCLALEDGKELWRVDFVKQLEAPLPSFGFVSSPLLDQGSVYVQAGASVVCLDKATGAIRWRALKDGGGMWGSAFSSPVLTQLAGRKQLVVLTREKLAGLDPADGKVLWEQKVEAFRGMNILTPVVTTNGVMTAAYGGRSHFFEVRPAGDHCEVREAWNFKAQGYMSTPVVLRDHAWLHLRNQRLLCLDLRTGAERWTTDRSFGKYWSLVANGDRILALDQSGDLRLLSANPERFELLDAQKVSEAETWAHLAVSGDLLFIRELNGLTAWRWAEPKVSGL